MSKPDKPGELRDVDVKAVSLVSRAANKHKFAIFKSANKNNTEKEEAEHVSKPTKEGFFDICTKFFTGDHSESTESTEKGTVKDKVNTTIKGQMLSAALDGLQSALFWGNDASVKKGDWSGVKKAANEFAEICAAIADGDDLLKSEALAELEKAGKKICGARMKKLMEIKSALDAIIAEGDETETEKGEAADMTKEELSAIIKAETGPITERLDKLETEKGGEEAKKAEEAKVETLTAEDVTKAVAAAVEPLSGRIETLEKARGMSNKIADNGDDAQKSEDGIWGGSIIG